MRAVVTNVQVWLPMAILPVVIGVVMPTVLVGAVAYAGLENGGNLASVIKMVDSLSASSLGRLLGGLPSLEQKVAFVAANYLFSPLFLLIPLMTSSVITADSFAGEKERGTLESLLFAPVDLLSLLVGKVLAAFLPALALSVGSLLLATVTVNAAGWKLFGRLFFPQWNWLPLMLLVIPMVSLTAILVNVFISARVASFQAAYQVGGLVVLPVLALLVGQVSGLLMLSAWVMVVLGLVLALINLVLAQQILRRLDRNRLFESQIR